MPFTKGHKINLGRRWVVSEEARKKLSVLRLANPNRFKKHLNGCTCFKCRSIAKEKHWNWKGGITQKQSLLRKLCHLCKGVRDTFHSSRYCISCRTKSCKQCSAVFVFKPGAKKQQKFCSKKCHTASQIGYRMPWELGHKKISENKKGKYVACNFCGKLSYKYPRTIAKQWKANFCNKICFTNWSRSSDNPNWKGDDYPENKRLRSSREYKNWREAIWKRDDYTCQFCGKRNGKISADHIKSWCMFPELRFSLENGRTLCYDCHRKTDTWGVKAKYQKIYNNQK